MQYRYEVISATRARKYIDPRTGEPRYRLDVISAKPIGHKAKPVKPKVDPLVAKKVNAEGRRRAKARAKNLPTLVEVNGEWVVKRKALKDLL